MNVVNDLLDFSKIEAGNVEIDPVCFHLRESLEKTMEALAVKARQKNIDLALQIAPSVPDFVIGDAVRLRQILMNLVGNAIKFTAAGKVSLQASIEEDSQNRLMLHFAVHDTGIGIAPDKQRLIFEAFSQADNSNTREFGGTGLGLAICARLVEAMQGRIWVESVLGQGSSFHFNACLKRPDMNHNAPAGEADKTPINVVPQSATPKSLRILLAEDNPVNQRLAARMLEKEGHEVAVASNGKEAFAMWLDSPFDLILMDMQMPEMDGFQTTFAIRRAEVASNAHIPIIALTAHAMHGYRERCLAAGMDDYLTKPFRKNDLLVTIAKHTNAQRALMLT